MRKFAVAILLLSPFLATRAWAQANVNESLETAFIYVDAANGSDSNPGTQALPYKTIGKGASVAETNNRNGIGTRVTINPGTYREAVVLGADAQDSSLPITFEAATTGTAVMSGADIWTGWTPYGANPNISTHPWQYNWGLCPTDAGCPPIFQDIIRRREMVIINGAVQTQMLSLNQLVPGSFFVDESGGTLYVDPPSGTDLNGATVEVATRGGLLSINGKTNVVVRGLTFQYDNSCRSGAALTVYNSTNVLFDSDTFLWNNSKGLSINHPTASVTIQNCVSNHNGSMGFHAFQVKNVLWQSDDASYNNWRGAQGAYYGCNNEGVLFFSTHENTISGFTGFFNQARGFHWDTDNANITVSGMNSASNLNEGAQIEKDEGPFNISGSFFCNNGAPLALPSMGGVSLRDSESVTFSNDVFSNNISNQLALVGQLGGISVSNWETGQQYLLLNKNMTLTQSTLLGYGVQPVFDDSFLGGSDWSAFASTLTSNNNTWWNATDDTPFVVPSPKLNTIDSFSAWRSLTGQDSGSSFAPPGGNPAAACQVAPDRADFWFSSPVQSVTAAAGASAAFTLTVTPLAFSGTVQLSADGAQQIPGATGSWSEGAINSSGSATYTVITQKSSPSGTYPITLIASSGNFVRTVTLSLILQGTALGPAPPTNLRATVN